MSTVRRATAADAAELTRLREMVLIVLGQDVEELSWRPNAIAAFEERLAPGGDLAGFVIDGDQGVLAAGAVGFVVNLLPGPTRPDGRTGYLLNVATDPRYRRRGHARAVTTAMLDWFHGQGVRRVELYTTTESDALYAGLGFTEHPSRVLTWAERRRI
jgi:ribosomal protein S18 acetylase RimI-like enzyme